MNNYHKAKGITASKVKMIEIPEIQLNTLMKENKLLREHIKKMDQHITEIKWLLNSANELIDSLTPYKEKALQVKLQHDIGLNRHRKGKRNAIIFEYYRRLAGRNPNTAKSTIYRALARKSGLNPKTIERIIKAQITGD